MKLNELLKQFKNELEKNKKIYKFNKQVFMKKYHKIFKDVKYYDINKIENIKKYVYQYIIKNNIYDIKNILLNELQEKHFGKINEKYQLDNFEIFIFTAEFKSKEKLISVEIFIDFLYDSYKILKIRLEGMFLNDTKNLETLNKIYKYVDQVEGEYNYSIPFFKKYCINEMEDKIKVTENQLNNVKNSTFVRII